MSYGPGKLMVKDTLGWVARFEAPIVPELLVIHEGGQIESLHHAVVLVTLSDRVKEFDEAED